MNNCSQTFSKAVKLLVELASLQVMYIIEFRVKICYLFASYNPGLAFVLVQLHLNGIIFVYNLVEIILLSCHCPVSNNFLLLLISYAIKEVKLTFTCAVFCLCKNIMGNHIDCTSLSNSCFTSSCYKQHLYYAFVLYAKNYN